MFRSAFVLVSAIALGLMLSSQIIVRADVPGGLVLAQADNAARESLPEGALVRLGSNRFNPGGKIQTLVFGPDGKWLASGDVDATVTVWETQSGKVLATLKGHKGLITKLAVLPASDGKPAVLVSASADATIRFWDVKAAKETELIINHPGPATALAVAPDGKTVVSGGEGRLFFWDAATGKEVKRLDAHPGATTCLAFSADGKMLASGGMPKSIDFNAPRDGDALFLWDAATGKQLKNFAGFDFYLAGVALSPDGKILAAGGEYFRTNNPFYWDTDTGKRLGDKRFVTGGCRAMALSPDGKTLAVGDHNEVRFVDLESQNEQRSLTHQHRFATLKTIAYSPDGDTLATAGEDGQIKLWDVPRRVARAGESMHSQTITTLAVSPDGKSIVTVGEDGVRLWDRDKGTFVRKLPTHSPSGEERGATAVRFLPHKNTIMLTSPYVGASFWDWPSGKFQREVTFAEKNIFARASSADGCVFAGYSGTLQEQISILDGRTGKSIRKITTKKRGPLLTISPNGQYVASTSFPPDNSMALWSVESGELVYEKKVGLCHTVAFCPGNVVLAMKKPGSVSLLEIATGNVIGSIATQTYHVGELLAVSPDGRVLAILETEPQQRPERTSIELVEIATGKKLRRLAGHRATMTTAAFTPDGKALVSASDDRTALVWDVAGILAPAKVADFAPLWDDLANADRMRAYAAFCHLRGSPAEAVALFKKRLTAAPAEGDLEKLRRTWAICLLEDLNSVAAQELLQTLAAGKAADAVEAQAALKRLNRAQAK